MVIYTKSQANDVTCYNKRAIICHTGLKYVVIATKKNNLTCGLQIVGKMF